MARRARFNRAMADWAQALHGDEVRAAYRAAVPRGGFPAWVILAESALELEPLDSLPTGSLDVRDVIEGAPAMVRGAGSWDR